MKQNLAIEFLKRCVTSHGFVASPKQHDNYHRIWSRDAVIMGLSAALSNNSELLAALKESIRTLGNFQAEDGQIPSNVDFIQNKASYGTLVGRVDATTWWIIGACISIKKDSSLLTEWKPKIRKAFNLLRSWEMNQRGLMYTPMGGNWADEYVTAGYVLYDQLLRLWAYKAFEQIESNEEIQTQISSLENLIVANYNLNQEEGKRYHEIAFQKANCKPLHWAAALAPSGYDTRWDMAANALALLLKLPFDNSKIVSFLHQRQTEFKHNLFPVFYPIIERIDWEWRLLENNHLYEFKNEPNCFHNGGAWPVFLGLLSLGLASNNLEDLSEKIWNDFDACTNKYPEALFSEYWNTKHLTPGGVSELGFSAAGTIFMSLALNTNYNLKEIML
jgi:hypothetical protein